MPAFPTMSNRVEVRVKGTAAGIMNREDLVAGLCLFILLVYCTATIFVKAAWPLQSFQMGVFALLAVYLVTGIRKREEGAAKGVAPLLVYFIPVWGLIQILAHTTTSTFQTREAVLRWGALAAVFFLVQIVVRTPAAREIALHAMLFFATVMALLCLTQLFTSKGLVLWIFPSGYPDVYATFPSYNNYAQFIEISLPIAVWYSLRKGLQSWGYILVAGTLYASVIRAASRAGAALCTAELLAILAMRAIGPLKLNRRETKLRMRSITLVLALVPLVAVTFTFVVGWRRIWQRFQQHDDSYLVRSEFLIPTIDMAVHRPLIGYGLGTFPDVYPQYAIKDFPFYVNYAHNDWAEFAADGGIPFLLLVLIPFAAVVPTAIRHPWGLGLVAVMLHACVDFPFPRPAVSGWLFAMLGLLYVARASDRHEDRFKISPGRHDPPTVLEFKH